MNVGRTTLDRSMPGLTCFMRNQTMDLFSSLNSSVWSLTVPKTSGGASV